MARATRTPARKTPARSAKAQADIDAAMNEIAAWADATSTSGYCEPLHQAVSKYLDRCAKRRSVLDAFSVPLA